MTVGQRIKARRIELNLSAEQLAEKIGVSPATIYRYENGGIRHMGTDKLAIIADALSIEPKYLMGWKDVSELLPKNLQKASDLPMRRVPILGPVAAGQPIPAMREYDDYVDIPDTGGRYDAALRVQGDSMTPHYLPNDLVFIRYCDDVIDGQIAAVALDDDVVLKKVYHVSGGVTLISVNPAYAPMIFTSDDVSNIHIVGLAVGYLRWEH